MNTMESDIKEAVVKAFEEIIARNEIKEFIKGELYKAINKEEPEKWITVKGNHIPIFKGQTEEEAVKKFLKNKIKTQQTKSKGFKDQPKNWEKANSGNVNPNFLKGEEYKCNCQSCVLVFEARLRGQNIQTLPYEESNILMRKLGIYPNLGYIDRKTGQHPSFTESNTRNINDCLKYLEKNINQGERYIFGFRKKQDLKKHVVIVIKSPEDNIIFYDTQSGKYYNKDMLNEIEFANRRIDGYINKSPQLLRIDDKDLDLKYLSKVSKQN